MYILKPTKNFVRKYKKLIKNNPILEVQILKVLKQLRKDPFYSGLKSHKLKGIDNLYSSWVNGDIRILWDFDDSNNLVLLLIDIGGHSGTKGVY